MNTPSKRGHIIQIIPIWDEGERFIVMEWDEWSDSGQLISDLEDRDEAIALARQVADELGYELIGADVVPFNPEGTI